MTELKYKFCKIRPNKTITFLIFVLLILPLFAEEAQFNIATYNIRQKNQDDIKRGDGWENRGDIIAKLIRFHEFDIFGTQEGFKDQLEDLKALLPGFEYTGVARDDGKEMGEYSAIFFNTDIFELVDHDDFWLSETPEKPGLGWDAACVRICSWGKFLHKPSGKSFRFYNLHLDHVGEKAREESCKLVLEKIRETGDDLPTFLSGDFNVDQHNEIYKILTSSNLLKDSFDSADFVYALNGTFNGFQTDGFTDSRIDHIFVTDDIKVQKYGVLTDTYRTPVSIKETLETTAAPSEISITSYKARNPSDHYPVVLKVSL